MSATPPPAPPSDPDRTRLAWAFLLGVVTALLGVKLYWGRLSRPTDERSGPVAAYRIDINRAPPGELAQLSGVGPARAQQIVDGRPYQHPVDLDRVPGFGPATLARVQPHVTAGPTWSKPTRPTAALVDPNHANAGELQTLPSIGPKLAQRIIDERAKRPFANVDDLRRVAGIGPKTLEKLRPFLTFGPMPADDPAPIAPAGHLP